MRLEVSTAPREQEGQSFKDPIGRGVDTGYEHGALRSPQRHSP